MISREQQRVKAAQNLLNINPKIQKDLDELVNLTAQMCEVPIALITIMDEDMQWFKATKGADLHCNTREASFCRYTIEQENLLIVPDTTADFRFADHPFVTGAPFIKFYAGANLTTLEGLHVGTLCVYDLSVRTLSDAQQSALLVLAKQVINLMQLSWSLTTLDEQYEETLRQKRAIETSEVQLKAIFNSSKDIFILLGKQMEVLAFNKAAQNHFRKTEGIALVAGKSIVSYIDENSYNVVKVEYEKALRGNSTKLEWLIRPDTKHAAWMETSFMPVRNDSEILGVALNATDITVRKVGEEQIRLKNEALQRIAIIQSHELRRPVASLLGMLELIKTEQEEINLNFTYFSMLETLIQDLDSKIYEIVSDSETTLDIQRLLV